MNSGQREVDFLTLYRPVMAGRRWGEGAELTPRHSQTCNSEYVDMFVAAPGALEPASEEEGHSCKQLVSKYTEA